MKNQILKIVQQHPRTYSHHIKKDSALLEWIDTNSTAQTDHLPSKIYSALTGETTVCKYGNQKKFTRISTGFNFVRETGPGYFWTDGNTVYSRYRCQKKNLSKWLSSFNSDLSEAENLFRAGYRRYWTCGNLVFEKKKY